MTTEEQDMIVANVSLKYAQSNSIAIAKHGQIIGLGCGQQNRVDCVNLAGIKSVIWRSRMKHTEMIQQLRSQGVKKQDRINKIYEEIMKEIACIGLIVSDEIGTLTLASDGFIPFPDNIHEAYKYGITHIIQPGGSTADKEIDTVCKEYGITHIKTGKRVFYH